MSVLMSSGPPPKYHPQPVGQPRKGYKWNRTTGTWDRDVGDAVEDGGSRKRPVGAPPKGKKWDSTTGAWVVKQFAESEDTEGGAPKVKKPRGPPKKFAGVPGKWDADSGKWVPSKAQEEAASSASAPDESASDVGRAEEATVERLGRSSGGKGKFRKIWANIWPWLICAPVLKADETCGSPAGASCPGCALCSVMRCVDCITRGKENVLGVGSPGSKCFNKSTISNVTRRFPGRAHGNQGRRKKGPGVPLSDLYEKEAREASKQAGMLLEESDDDSSVEEEGALSEDEEGDGQGADENDFTGQMEVGDFEVPPGWLLLPEPASPEDEWASMKKIYSWTNKRLAHIWDTPLGWQVACS